VGSQCQGRALRRAFEVVGFVEARADEKDIADLDVSTLSDWANVLERLVTSHSRRPGRLTIP
jgi:hypothetical protein